MHWKTTSIDEIAPWGTGDNSARVFLIPDSAGALKKDSLRIAAVLLTACCKIGGLWIHKTELGKPIVSDPRYHVSISHAGAYLMIGVARVNLGVDIEYLRHPDKWRDVYSWISHSSEESGGLNSRRFLECWTAKEAVLKLMGTGLDFGMHNIKLPPLYQDSFSFGSTGNTTFWIRLLPDWEDMRACIVLAHPLQLQTFRISSDAFSSTDDRFKGSQ